MKQSKMLQLESFFCGVVFCFIVFLILQDKSSNMAASKFTSWHMESLTAIK